MEEAVLRCKMRVASVTRSMAPDGTTDTETLTLQAVYGGTQENTKWSRWTPSAQFTMTISNPDAFGKLAREHEVFVDFIPIK